MNRQEELAAMSKILNDITLRTERTITGDDIFNVTFDFSDGVEVLSIQKPVDKIMLAEWLIRAGKTMLNIKKLESE
jgi:hypothetical protein